ncbi:hypothetical protein NM688_g2539 [Phlebia brevispora]|uniref:Uncharacterized protein n=1 Tax=Phlebia brevispora TaxID=194682 RepID=A0ACC1T901_9APHY|nr:hypothetical protein NM688_g2539 [Phlebia brevispora]
MGEPIWSWFFQCETHTSTDNVIAGPIVHFHVFGRRFVLLNTLDVATDLFEKRSNIYSTKPRLVMAGELVERAKTSVLFLPYGQRLRECRRLVHSWVNKHAMASSYPVQEVGSHKLLETLLDDPSRFSDHIRTQAGAVILQLTYGFDCDPLNDPNIAMAEQLSSITAYATQPGRWLCDSFPWLAYIPYWLPGAGFRRWAKRARRVSHDVIRIPYEMVEKAVVDGSAPPSWTASAIIDEKGQLKTGLDAFNLMTAAGTMFAGGIHTTVASIRTFFLVMTRHPEIQKKAQAEIDRVVGHDRLPTINDRSSLPYVNNLITEVLRFNPVVPVIPHSLDNDDIYEGYLIPKGAWVMVNAWAILQDPNTYHSPDEFIPERYDGIDDYPPEPDLSYISFGFGRRACPGIHFAHAMMFLNISHVLAAFNIGPYVNGEGKSEVPPLLFDTGHLRVPANFRCSIVPRDADKEKLIRHLVTAAAAGKATPN